jgi:hypothetical protein
MLEAFASVGAIRFDLTITDRQGMKVRFSRDVPTERLLSLMPDELESATAWEHNVIVRPRGADVFIQLDDLAAEAIERVSPVSFLGLKTSPANFQAWIAMNEATADVARQLRKSTGADPSASGATRVAGSFNFKNKYAPDYPQIEIVHGFQRRIASKEALASIGITLDVPKAPRPVFPVRGTMSGVSRWPSYQICLDRAPRAHGDPRRPDVSRADFTWCMIAIDWGWTIEDTAQKLSVESSKAQENGERYAINTAQRAALVVRDRRSKDPLPSQRTGNVTKLLL